MQTKVTPSPALIVHIIETEQGGETAELEVGIGVTEDDGGQWYWVQGHHFIDGKAFNVNGSVNPAGEIDYNLTDLSIDPFEGLS